MVTGVLEHSSSFIRLVSYSYYELIMPHCYQRDYLPFVLAVGVRNYVNLKNAVCSCDRDSLLSREPIVTSFSPPCMGKTSGVKTFIPISIETEL